MKLERVTVRGLLAFRGPEAVTLDLTALPPGLIAITGNNGEGKSSLLDACLAAPFRRMPSREGELVDFATDRDSYVEAVYAFDGQGEYRARVSLDKIRRNSDAVLVHTTLSGTTTVMSDGKVSSFDAAIARVFPPQHVLLGSAFAAQNRAGSFITADRKARKALFSSLLGLDHLEAMSTTAKAAAGLIESARHRLAARLDLLARDTSDDVVALCDDTARALAIEAEQAAHERVDLQARLSALEEELTSIHSQVAAYTAACERIRHLDADRATKVAEHGGVVQAIDSTEVRAREVVARLRQTATAEADALATKVANNKGLIDRAEAIRTAVRETARLQAALETHRDAEAVLVRAVDEKTRTLRHADALIAEARGRAQQLDRARRDAQTLNTVPCAGAGVYATCQFLTDATAAAEQVPALEVQIAADAHLEQDRGRHEQDLATLRTQLATVRTRVNEVNQALAGHRDTAALADRLAAAEARIAELTAQQVRAAAESARQIAETEARASEDLAGLQARRRELATALDRVDGDLARATAERDAVSAAQDRATHVRASLVEVRRAWDRVTHTLASVAERRDELERRRIALEAKLTERVQVAATIAAHDRELDEWRLLARMLGRDGLPVLEIDAAGPTVSALTNDILLGCYGPRFSVEIVTQEAKVTKGKDGSSHKEVFSIAVTDNDTGEVRDVGILSGGEQVIIDEALKSAIALLLNQRTAIPIRTAWRDETTGPLSEANRPKYMDMLRRVHQLGGFVHTLVVTHDAEAAAAADAQVRVADGRIAIAFPPYEAAS